jgi:hypothetical protein
MERWSLDFNVLNTIATEADRDTDLGDRFLSLAKALSIGLKSGR